MKYNTKRTIKLITIFLIGFLFMQCAFLFLNASYWLQHTTYIGNIADRVDIEIIKQNFDDMNATLNMEGFLLNVIMIPYLLIGIPLIVLSGFIDKKKSWWKK